MTCLLLVLQYAILTYAIVTGSPTLWTTSTVKPQNDLILISALSFMYCSF